MGTLADFLNKKQKTSPFLRLEEGEKVRFTPVKEEEIQSPFRPEETIMKYVVETEDGETKEFSCGSIVFALQWKEARKNPDRPMWLTKQRIKTRFGEKVSWQIIFEK